MLENNSKQQGGGKGEGGKSSKHAAALPPDLASFVPFQQMPSIKAFKAALAPLEKAFAEAPSGGAAEALRAKTANAARVLAAAIDERVKEKNVVKKCDAAILAGADAFTDVYAAVNAMIFTTEASGMRKLSDELSEVRLRARVGRNGATALQRTDDLLTLYADAAAARPLATALVGRLAKDSGISPPEKPTPLKATVRILEKSLLRPRPGDDARRGGCERVCDVVRDMLICTKAEQLAKLVSAFFDDEAISVVRVKDRFKTPSGGGWRDIMINYTMLSDPSKHVCEVRAWEATHPCTPAPLHPCTPAPLLLPLLLLLLHPTAISPPPPTPLSPASLSPLWLLSGRCKSCTTRS